jgi:hypothetical protein
LETDSGGDWWLTQRAFLKLPIDKQQNVDPCLFAYVTGKRFTNLATKQWLNNRPVGAWTAASLSATRDAHLEI